MIAQRMDERRDVYIMTHLLVGWLIRMGCETAIAGHVTAYTSVLVVSPFLASPHSGKPFNVEPRREHRRCRYGGFVYSIGPQWDH